VRSRTHHRQDVIGRSGIGVLAAVCIALALPGSAGAADIVVDTTADAPSDNDCLRTSCTLRDAVSVAQITDVVRVPAGRYQLTQGEISLVNKQIEGESAATTIIDGGDASRVFIAPQGMNSISGLTITNGRPTGQVVLGGGILVQSGSFTLVDSAVVGNSAPTGGGGIASGGTLSLIRTTVADNETTPTFTPNTQGGGLYLAGTASITNSTVSGNRAVAGGNIFNEGVLSLDYVTIAADLQGGGLNQAAAAAAATSTTMSNSIVAGGAGPACAGTVAQINQTAGSHNVVDDTSCALGGPGDRENVDPLLGPLADNAGPTTTHALLAGSPAIGAANPSACVGTDQRSTSRPQEGTCDAGAFEYVPPPQQQPNTPPQSPTPLPPPEVRKTVNVIPARGTIRIKPPGQKRFRTLAADGAQLPVGTTVDALKGRVRIVAASDAQGGTDTALFYGGIFKIAQTRGKKPTTVLTLNEKLTCAKAGGARIAAKGKRKRRLWGDGSGKFRTKGKHSAATVVGTKWLVEDRCKSTLTRVVRGRVSVRDFVKKKTIIVRRGKRYTARAG
jgi:CSLREA domain-containing protein